MPVNLFYNPLIDSSILSLDLVSVERPIALIY